MPPPLPQLQSPSHAFPDHRSPQLPLLFAGDRHGRLGSSSAPSSQVPLLSSGVVHHVPLLPAVLPSPRVRLRSLFGRKPQVRPSSLSFGRLSVRPPQAPSRLPDSTCVSPSFRRVALPSLPRLPVAGSTLSPLPVRLCLPMAPPLAVISPLPRTSSLRDGGVGASRTRWCPHLGRRRRGQRRQRPARAPLLLSRASPREEEDDHAGPPCRMGPPCKWLRPWVHMDKWTRKQFAGPAGFNCLYAVDSLFAS
ncbi:uncharacterized protein [Triticum aestivum]|uniref:uncharacterized protein n=1 Tax=Triticum aestivum TaxID=4565 RepID=UPI001D002F22|nr:uncharacterized protein LOC123065209 [Triticum aestivum]